MLKLIETVWRTKFTFYFQAIRKLNFGRKYTGFRLIAPQLLSCGENNLQIPDPHQISGGIMIFQTKSMTWSKKNFSDIQSIDFCDFRRFSGILNGNMNYTTFFTRITNIRFFFASAEWLLSYEHIQKPEVQNGTVFFPNLKHELRFLTNKHQSNKT